MTEIIETENVEELVDENTDESTDDAVEEIAEADEADAMPKKTASDKVKSLTNGDWFAGYGTADLRAWLRFWKNEKRSKGHALELAEKDPRFAEMYRADHIRMLEEEIAARDAARSLGGPNA